MNLIIAAASIYMPVFLKRKKLEELVAGTAEAFGCDMPPVGRLPYDQLLRAYACFTATQAEQVLKQEGVIASDLREEVPAGAEQAIASSRTPPLPGSCRTALLSQSLPGASVATKQSRRGQQGRDLAEIRRRLYDGAYRMGQDLRRAFRVANTSDALAAARVLYRALGIDLQAAGGGEIVVRRCFFSQHYSGAVCQVIASLDEGLFAGLSNGGQLAFYQRITEGHECCQAHFRESP
jgi:hypothetical protein